MAISHFSIKRLAGWRLNYQVFLSRVDSVSHLPGESSSTAKPKIRRGFCSCFCGATVAELLPDDQSRIFTGLAERPNRRANGAESQKFKSAHCFSATPTGAAGRLVFEIRRTVHCPLQLECTAQGRQTTVPGRLVATLETASQAGNASNNKQQREGRRRSRRNNIIIIFSSSAAYLVARYSRR